MALTLTVGCRTYHPRPVDPAATETGLRARSLDDPALRAYLEAVRPTAIPGPLRTLDLQTLTLVALHFHPALETARAHAEVANAAIVTAGARPNPTITWTPEYITNPEFGTPWSLGWTFDVPIETAGKRGHRIARAERLSEAARLDVAETAWSIRSAVHRACVERLTAIRQVDLLHDEEEARREAVALMRARLAVGEVSRPDVDVAETDLARTILTRRASEGQVSEAQATLAAAIGLPISALAGVTVDCTALDHLPPEPPSPTSLHRAGLLNRLDVRRTLIEYAAADATLRLEVAKQYPDLHLSPGYVWDEGENRIALGLSLTLPILNQNQGPIAEAEAGRREVAARLLALQAQVIAETDRAFASYRTALVEWTEAEHLVALLDAQVNATRRMVAVGDEDRLALAGLTLQRIVAQRARLEALRKAQAALVALEDAVQRPLRADDLAEPWLALPPRLPPGDAS